MVGTRDQNAGPQIGMQIVQTNPIGHGLLPKTKPKCR